MRPDTPDDYAALGRVCPNCNARPGYSCTQPTNTGRRPVSWFHDSRKNVS